MKISKAFLLGLIFFFGCNPTALRDVRVEISSEMRKLTKELQGIDSLDRLERSLVRLSRRYEEIARCLVLAENFEEKSEFYREEAFVSDAAEELFLELARLYEIPGARELLEKAQDKGLMFYKSNRLGSEEISK